VVGGTGAWWDGFQGTTDLRKRRRFEALRPKADVSQDVCRNEEVARDGKTLSVAPVNKDTGEEDSIWRLNAAAGEQNKSSQKPDI